MVIWHKESRQEQSHTIVWYILLSPALLMGFLFDLAMRGLPCATLAVLFLSFEKYGTDKG